MKMLRFAFATASALLAACNGSGSGHPDGTSPTATRTTPQRGILPGDSGGLDRMRAEVLPADGGELGKAFAQLATSYRDNDVSRAASILTTPLSHLTAGNGLGNFSERVATFHVTGGRSYRDYATLFLANSEGYAIWNAIHSADGWRFTFPVPIATETVVDAAPKCSSMVFPCGIATVPDAKVSGTLQSHRAKQQLPDSMEITSDDFPGDALFDGFATRVLDEKSNELKFTRVVLTGSGVDPQGIAQLSNFHGNWAGHVPALLLDVASDGKTAKLTFLSADMYSLDDNPSTDVTRGLSIDQNGPPKRIRGSLKTDLKDVAKIDVAFDLGTNSYCQANSDQCR